MNNRQSGIEGENAAVEYLQNQGYKILRRNFSVKVGEIDIIALDGNTLVFIEVKSRENLRFGHPIESIGYKKVRSIIKTAQWYMLAEKKQNSSCRFDVIEVLRGQINHVKNAFDASY